MVDQSCSRIVSRAVGQHGSSASSPWGTDGAQRRLRQNCCSRAANAAHVVVIAAVALAPVLALALALALARALAIALGRALVLALAPPHLPPRSG